MRVPGFLAAAAAGSVCNCVLAVFPVLPAAAELFLAAAGIGSLMCWLAFSPGTPGGNQERFPFPAYSGKYGTEPGAEPDRSVFLQAAGEFQEVRSRHFHPYQLCAV